MKRVYTNIFIKVGFVAKIEIKRQWPTMTVHTWSNGKCLHRFVLEGHIWQFRVASSRLVAVIDPCSVTCLTVQALLVLLLSNCQPLSFSCDCCCYYYSRQRLRSASRCQLTVPRHRRSTFGRRAFSVAGPAVWNLLPDQLKDSGCTELTFGRTLKTFFFDQY